MNNDNYKKIILILFCALLPIFLMLLSYKTVLIFTDLDSAQQNVFDFLADKAELRQGFTADEASHLVDVKKLMDKIDIFFYALLFLLTIAWTYHKKDKESITQFFKYGGIGTASSISFILVALSFFFNYTFTFFHLIFFPQGNWVFPAESLLIQTFPWTFFFSIARNIFLLSLFLGIIFISLSYYLQYVHRKRH
ncbi:MAG: DUF1461 domain-containing protein [Nanoarchaeota archaeon]